MALTITQSNAQWNQIGNNLIGSETRGYSDQGHEVKILTDGKTAIVGSLICLSYMVNFVIQK